jgi:hypothetical protein
VRGPNESIKVGQIELTNAGSQPGDRTNTEYSFGPPRGPGIAAVRSAP